jgi:hypothetical protein
VELEQLLQTAYPSGAPARIVSFLDGTLTDEDEIRAAHDAIVSTAEAYESAHQKIAERLGAISGTITNCRRKLGELEIRLNEGDYLHFADDLLSQQLQAKQANEWIISRAAGEVAKLKSDPYYDPERARAWSELRRLADDRVNAFVQDPDRLEAMTTEQLLELLFPENVPGFDPAMIPGSLYRASTVEVRRWKIKELVRMFERDGVGGDIRAEIYGIRQRHMRSPAANDRAATLACTQLLALAEKTQPTPAGFPKYL